MELPEYNTSLDDLRRCEPLSQIQHEIKIWSAYNFPDNTEEHPRLGMVEELGELHHAVLKAKQGIRGTAEEHLAAEKDALADLMIYLLDYCNQRGFDAQDILAETWHRVRQRDWRKDNVKGVVG